MLLSRDPVTRITRRMHYHEPDDTAIVTHEQDDREIIAGNQRAYNSYRRSNAKHAEWGDHYGRISQVVWGRLVEQGIAFDDKALVDWLNNPDNRNFRRRPGRM